MTTPLRDTRYDTLTPAFRVSVGGSELPPEVAGDVYAVTVVDDVDAASMCVVRMRCWDGVLMKVRWIDEERFAEGAPIDVEFGFGDQMKKLFSGEIVGLEPDFGEDMPPTLALRGYDVRHRLMREQRTHSYLDAKDSDIVSQVAQAAGLQARAKDSQITFPYLLQHNQTDFQFLAARAARIGWELAADGKTLLFRPRPSDGSPELTLRREIELLQFRPRLSTMGQSPKREVRGWSPKDKREVVATAKVGDEGKLMGSTSGGSATQRAFSKSGTLLVDRPIHSAEDAEQLAQQGFREMGRAYIQAEGLCIGEPRLHAGMVVKIEGLGERFSGNYYVNLVEHRFDPKAGYRTRFTARRNAT